MRSNSSWSRSRTMGSTAANGSSMSMTGGSAAAYDLNTVLQKDPTIGSKMEAVGRTMELIVKALDNTKTSYRYTIGDYSKLLR